MSDLISREDAIKAVHDEFDECCVWDESGERTADEVEAILDRVPSAEPNPLCALADRACPFQGDEFHWCLTCPHISEDDRRLMRKAIDASEPKTGEWLMRDGVYGATYCSECNYELRINDVNYCPNCGADMRGENG